MALQFRPVVLVTGCSNGLGLALTKALVETDRFRVIATARHQSFALLKEHFSESDNLILRELDVTSPSERQSVVAECYQLWKSLDVLINNAAVSYRSVVEHMDEESELHQLNTNYLGPMALIRLALPSMREKGRGKIINISSVSGMVAMPTMASYSASKHALEGASEALWYEMKPFGIDVSLVQPGFIRSDSFEKVYFSKKAQLSATLEGPYADYYTNITPFVKKLMNFSLSSPNDISKKIIKIIRTQGPPLWVPVTIDAAIFFYLRKIIPRTLFHGFMKAFLPNSKSWGARFTRARQTKN